MGFSTGDGDGCCITAMKVIRCEMGLHTFRRIISVQRHRSTTSSKISRIKKSDFKRVFVLQRRTKYVCPVLEIQNEIYVLIGIGNKYANKLIG